MSGWVRLGFDSRSIRNWDDGTVLYNVLSGETHVLGPMAGIALREIAAGAATTATLHAVLTAQLPELEPQLLHEELEALLTEMARLGVIASEPS